MFTEGLDNTALKWVREGSVTSSNEKEEPLSVLNQRTRVVVDPMLGNRPGNTRGFGLPQTRKFRSGRLSLNTIPISRVIPGDDSVSASDNDMITSESEEEDVYGGRYSLDSSPQDGRAPLANAGRYRYSNSKTLPSSRVSYGSEYLSSDVYSSVEWNGKSVGPGGPEGERLAKGNERHTVGRNGFVEDDSTDSGASSEFSVSQVGSNAGAVSRSQAGVSESYTSSANSRPNAEKDSGGTPSAPPVCSSDHETNHTMAIGHDKISAVSDDVLTKHKANASNITSNVANQPVNTGNEIRDPHTRTATCAESSGSSGSHPARLPTFHASTQGPWHSVLAYDACVRLCLNAWARGCTEAPIFLENECALLRDAFGLHQILLQSEEELMSKRGSEVAAEKAPQKPKKIIGKMKVQVILEHFDQVVGYCFMDCVNCLIEFANNKSSHRISLKAIELCEDRLAEGFVLCTKDLGECTKDLSEQRLKAIQVASSNRNTGKRHNRNRIRELSVASQMKFARKRGWLAGSPPQLPKSFSWLSRNPSIFGPVRRQVGPTCLPEATIGCLEALQALESGTFLSLSVQELIDKVPEFSYVSNIAEFVVNYGVSLREDYPDTFQGKQQPIPRGKGWFNYQPTEFVPLADPTDDIAIMKCLLRRPMLALIKAIPRLAKISHVDPVYTIPLSEYTPGPTHAVMLCAWEEEMWVFRNSYGDWGKKGLGKMPRAKFVPKDELYAIEHVLFLIGSNEDRTTFPELQDHWVQHWI